MSGWVKDLRGVLVDDTHIVLTQEQYRSLDCYTSIGQPTNPSVGRAYRTGDGCYECRRIEKAGGDITEHPHQVVFVEADPDPTFVLRVGRLPLFVETGNM